MNENQSRELPPYYGVSGFRSHSGFDDDLMTIRDQLGIKDKLITHFDDKASNSNSVNRIETMAGAVRTMMREDGSCMCCVGGDYCG